MSPLQLMFQLEIDRFIFFRADSDTDYFDISLIQWYASPAWNPFGSQASFLTSIESFSKASHRKVKHSSLPIVIT